MNRLDELENHSIWVLREARRHFGRLAMLWSIGKDSNTLLWLTRKAFFDDMPFPYVHIDTSYKPPEMIAFRDKLAREYNIDLVTGMNKKALAAGMNHTQGRMNCCKALKTDALQQIIAENNYQAVIAGIRHDEEGSRRKERIFSPRGNRFSWDYKDQPPEFWGQFAIPEDETTHVRIHPLLKWTEMDVWQYIERENIPVCELYFARNGRRYRSLGCAPCNGSIASEATTVTEIIAELARTTTPERAGRAQDQEVAYAMQKLRQDGYM
ncbi:MAG: sulfate adenylyltransferase subunit CysD [Gammaproteobacteria bacterium]